MAQEKNSSLWIDRFGNLIDFEYLIANEHRVLELRANIALERLLEWRLKNAMDELLKRGLL